MSARMVAGRFSLTGAKAPDYSDALDAALKGRSSTAMVGVRTGIDESVSMTAQQTFGT